MAGKNKTALATSRSQQIQAFLKEHQAGSATRKPITSDASFRRYERLSLSGRNLILMDAPPEHEDTERFTHIDGYLRRRGFSAPEIYARDAESGFMLLEDFGDDSFTRILRGDSELSKQVDESTLYQAAIDVLIELGRSTLPRKMPDYDNAVLLKECNLLIDWYIPHFVGREIDATERTAYRRLWDDLCFKARIGNDVVVLRDYHADNLMWLPEREGAKCVGLLDFQDALIGSPIYDVVSLLEDARRDVSAKVVKEMIEYYVSSRKTIKREAFDAAYAILAAQRNCKIVGIFARLAIRDQKPKYLEYLPRVWGHITRDLDHPVLAPLTKWLKRFIPEEIRGQEAEYYKGVASQ